eukprot:SAG31_NODE_2759_length_5134_cov_5.037736_2_plen_127_part_00
MWRLSTNRIDERLQPSIAAGRQLEAYPVRRGYRSEPPESAVRFAVSRTSVLRARGAGGGSHDGSGSRRGAGARSIRSFWVEAGGRSEGRPIKDPLMAQLRAAADATGARMGVNTMRPAAACILYDK